MDNSKHIETERKYIIEKPSLELLASLPSYTVSEITQIYLSLSKEKTDRVRRRVYPTHTVYTRTIKTRIDGISNIEDEIEISEAEFLSLAKNMREDTTPLKKCRHTFTYLSKTFEGDNKTLANFVVCGESAEKFWSSFFKSLRYPKAEPWSLVATSETLNRSKAPRGVNFKSRKDFERGEHTSGGSPKTQRNEHLLTCS